jgi:hypothetical protein
MKRSSELYRKTMITHDVHDPKDYLVRSDEEPCRKQDAEEDDGDEEEGDVVSLPSESSSGVHEKVQRPTFSLVSLFQYCSERTVLILN